MDVLHALLERAGSFGVHTLQELTGFVRAPTPEQRRKRHLAEAIPSAPGVYVFEDDRGEPLYVGKSVNLRTRVRGYFTASETRPGSGRWSASPNGSGRSSARPRWRRRSGNCG
nr:hypothetical protein GCM10020093_112430 [Planobispora longispora]